MPPTDAIGIRERLHEAVLICASRSAFRFSVEEVAVEAGVSRATVYRYFPGGKEQLISDGVRWEVGRFFSRVAEEVAHEPDVPSKIATALVVGRHLLDEHVVLRQLVREDPEVLLEQLSEVVPVMADGIRMYVAELLVQERLAAGVHVGEAADYVARLYLSYLGYSGEVDIDDPEQVRHLVATQFVGGILA